MLKPKRQSGNQAGFASIVVALILIVVLALLTVAFASLARREQQTALNKQLADAANYAAESGINDAYRDMTTIEPGSTSVSCPSGHTYIYDNSLCGTDTSSTNCMLPSTLPYGALTQNPSIKSSVSGSVEASYACLLVDMEPTNLNYTNVGAQTGDNLSFKTNPSLSSLEVGWGSADGNNGYQTSVGQFTPSSNWTGKAAVLQFSITPLATADRTSLISKTFTAYLYPDSNHDQIGTTTICTSSNCSINANNVALSGQGPIVSGVCNPTTTANGRSATYPCSVTLTGFTGSSYVIDFLNYYDESNVNITGQDSSGHPVHFLGGQAMIDVTGQAKNVLKRLQVRVPLSGNQLPNYALEAQNICKREEVFASNTEYIVANGTNPASGNDPCNLSY